MKTNLLIFFFFIVTALSACSKNSPSNQVSHTNSPPVSGAQVKQSTSSNQVSHTNSPPVSGAQVKQSTSDFTAESFIDWEKEQIKRPTEFISLQAKLPNLQKPPSIAYITSMAILHQGNQYWYPSFVCSEKPLHCEIYVALLEVGITGLAKNILKRQTVPFPNPENVEQYMMDEPMLVDIDQNGNPELVVRFHVHYNNQPGYGSQYEYYRALFHLPDLSLLILESESNDSTFPNCSSKWKRLPTLHDNHPDIKIMDVCQYSHCKNLKKPNPTCTPDTISDRKILCYGQGHYSVEACKS